MSETAQKFARVGALVVLIAVAGICVWPKVFDLYGDPMSTHMQALNLVTQLHNTHTGNDGTTASEHLGNIGFHVADKTGLAALAQLHKLRTGNDAVKTALGHVDKHLGTHGIKPLLQLGGYQQGSATPTAQDIVDPLVPGATPDFSTCKRWVYLNGKRYGKTFNEIITIALALRLAHEKDACLRLDARHWTGFFLYWFDFDRSVRAYSAWRPS